MGHVDMQTTMNYLHHAPRRDEPALVAEAFGIEARDGAVPQGHVEVASRLFVRPIQRAPDTPATRWHAWPPQRTHNGLLVRLGVVAVSAGETQKSGSGERYFGGRAKAASSQNS